MIAIPPQFSNFMKVKKYKNNFIPKMLQSRISVIEGHNKHNKTDQLYEPLRKTFEMDTTTKKTFLDDLSKVSRVSRSAKTHSYSENRQLGAKTLIPQDAKLRRCFDISKVPQGHYYCIVNGDEKILSSITREQLQLRLGRQKQGDQIIVYTYGSESSEESDYRDGNEYEKEESFQKYKSSYVPSKPMKKIKNPGIKVTQPKYNLFSILDEPVNSILSGGPCSCPGNEIIAGQRNEVSWENI